MKITTPCREFRASAKTSLKGHWGDAAITTLVYMIIGGACGSIPIASILLLFFVMSVLIYGYCIYFLNLCRGENVTLSNIFDGFQSYSTVAFTYILMYVYIMLWSLLFIIPGIIKSYSYALTYYIIKDYGLKNNDAIELSMKMMAGNKWKLFLLHLSFIGWILLGFLSLGIGFLWIVPYMMTAQAKFYLEVKEKYELGLQSNQQ